MTILRLFPPAAALALLLAAAPAAAVPAALTATYNVSRDGQPLGVATVTLRAGPDGTFVYGKDVAGTTGLAALLGANVHESSTFRWRGDVPEAVSYDYALDATVKRRQRHLRVDWTRGQVSVDEGKGVTKYPAVAGMVERNTLPLALGLALKGGARDVALKVAVRQEVETQQFKVTGTEEVIVPAGHYAALHVERTDADRGFAAWYVPDRYPLPVKLAQTDGGNMTMELVSYKAP